MKNRLFPNAAVPKTAVLEMTYQCNHRCLFCSVPWENPKGDYKKSGELTIEEWKNCIDRLVAHEVRGLAFSGGEPLLKQGLEEIIHYAHTKKIQTPAFDQQHNLIGSQEKHFEFSLITNGRLVNSRWVELFKKYHFTMIVSLPGINAFKDLTNGGNHELALRAIRQLSDAGLDVVVSICVTKKNLPELFETISLGFIHGAKQLLLNRFLLGGRGINHPELCLSEEEVIQMLDTAEEVCQTAKTRGSVGTELPKCILKKDYTMLKVGTLCSGGVDFFAIDPSGRVRPCNHSPVQLGSYQDIPSAIKSNYWQKFKCKDFLPRECSGCAMSLQCDGGCREAAHIVHGHLNSPDPLGVCHVPSRG
ncbi:MAG: radical SAM protein [bacterium]